MNDVRVVKYPQIDHLSSAHWREFHNHDPSFNEEYLKHSICIQAFDGDNPIGYLFMYVFPEPYEKGIVGMVDLYYVHTDYRKSGIGARMFKLAEIEAKSRGANRMAASSNIKKPHAEFFAGLGFTPTHISVSKVI